MRFIFTEDQVLKLKKTLSKQNISEDFLDDLLSKGTDIINKGIEAGKDFIAGLDVNVPEKSQDVETKADFISDNVDDFYKILENIDKPVTEQKYGSMVHQQSVEAVQIALQILGYELPRFGTDGLFGPETAKAVTKYKEDNSIEDTDDTADDLQEAAMIPPLPIQSGKSYRWNEQRKRGRHKGIDIPASVGTPIKCIADGKIIAAGALDSRCGDGISVEHADGFVSSYCHLSAIKVSSGQSVTQGDIIGLTGGAVGAPGSGNSQGPHLHLTLKKDGERVNPLEFFGSSIGTYYDDGSSSSVIGGSVITLPMVKKLIEDLRSKGITSEDLKAYIDPAVNSGGSLDFTDLDLSTQSGVDAYKEICDNYIKSRNPTAFVTGAMMAESAKTAFQRYRKYIPPELALSQLTLEGGISTDTTNRPIRTKNPFNVGNTPTKSNPRPTFEDGVNIYYDLIARRYLVKGKTANDLIYDFKNDNGNAYAASGYEDKLRTLVKDIRRKNEPIYAKLSKSKEQSITEELLAEADKRNAIMNALGFNQDWADEFHRLSDKLSIWIASTFLEKMIGEVRTRATIPEGQNPRTFVVNYLNDTGTRNNEGWNVTYKPMYEYIMHWIRAPRREQINIRELTLDSAHAMAQEWHDSLQIKKQSEYKEEGDVFIDYRNSDGIGYYWVHLHKNYCSDEADRMGHCARSNSGELISFRRINEFGEGESYLTVDYRPGGIIGDFHRHGNNKPTARFHNQIVDFLINQRYPVTQLTRSGVHRYDDNFQLADLSPENLRRVLQGNPNLRYNINDEATWPEIINAIISGDLTLSNYSAEISVRLLKKSEEIGTIERFSEKFTNDVIKNIMDNMDNLSTSDKRYFMSKFVNKIVEIVTASLGNELELTQEDFTDALRLISQNYFEYYEAFCPFIDRGFRMFSEEERVTILSQRGIKRTLFACTDSVPFLSRFVDNGPVDKNGNIAVKTEDGFWGLIKQSGENVMLPSLLAINLDMADRTGKKYLVKNMDGNFYSVDPEIGEYTRVNFKR